MAGHLPIKTEMFHEGIVNTIRDIKKLAYFKRYPHVTGIVQRLTPDYEMNEDHGLVDDEIISYTPSTRDRSYEIHLDSSGKINQVYLVM